MYLADERGIVVIDEAPAVGLTKLVIITLLQKINANFQIKWFYKHKLTQIFKIPFDFLTVSLVFLYYKWFKLSSRI